MSSTGARPPRPVVVAFGLTPMAARVSATLLIVAPLGFLMGTSMPLGMELIARSERLVFWGWSLNGVFSALASVAAIYCAIYIGTPRTFAIVPVAYVPAGAMLQIVHRRPTTPERA